jgi:hypothetical protein
MAYIFFAGYYINIIRILRVSFTKEVSASLVCAKKSISSLTISAPLPSPRTRTGTRCSKSAIAKHPEPLFGEWTRPAPSVTLRGCCARAKSAPRGLPVPAPRRPTRCRSTSTLGKRPTSTIHSPAESPRDSG